MIAVHLAAFAAISSQMLSMWGASAQVRCNHRRRSTRGLSLTEAECRIWGRLPWLLYTFSLANLDWPLVIGNGAGLLIGLVLIGQFLIYSDKPSSITLLRVAGQFAAVLIAVAVLVLARPELRQYFAIFGLLPFVTTLASLFIGCAAQLRETARSGLIEAVERRRYVAFALSNMIWLSYGIIKGCSLDWSGAWTICICSALGLGANVLILHRLRKPDAQSTLDESMDSTFEPELMAA